jgi:hypothetical protein
MLTFEDFSLEIRERQIREMSILTVYTKREF